MSKMESCARIVSGYKLLTTVAELTILDVCGSPDNATVHELIKRTTK